MLSAMAAHYRSNVHHPGGHAELTCSKTACLPKQQQRSSCLCLWLKRARSGPLYIGMELLDSMLEGSEDQR